MRQKSAASIIPLLLLALALWCAPAIVRAQIPKLTNTTLNIHRPDDSAKPWGNTLGIHARDILTLRWKTTDQIASTGVWQLSEENLSLGTNHPASKILADGDAGNSTVGVFYSFKEFNIDLTKLSFVAQTAPLLPKNYWVRLVRYDSANQIVGLSFSVKITYRKAITNITSIVVSPHGTYADISFATITPTIPIVEAGTNPMGGDVQSSAFPLLSGYQKNHVVRLQNLKPGTLYHCFIKVRDEKDSVASAKKSFSTLPRHLTVTFKDIYMIDDSDELSPGDLIFGFYLNGQLRLSANFALNTGQRRAFAAGQFTTFQSNPAEPLIIRVLGLDDDSTEWPLIGKPFDVSIQAQLERYDLLKTNSPGDAADAAVSILFPTGPDESMTLPFTIKANYGKLRFEAKGTYRAIYSTGGLLTDPDGSGRP